MAKDYHKYVFDDGKFIGNFDEMYKNCDDPWNCEQFQGSQMSYHLIAAYINCYRQMRGKANPKIFEIGSGKDFFCNFISNMGEVSGIEISGRAVEIARKKFPDINFIVGDIKNKNIFDSNCIKKEYFDFVIMFKGLIWYTIDVLDIVLGNISSSLKKDGIAIIEVNYYKGKYYGQEIIGNKEDFLALLGKKFSIEHVIDYYSKDNGLNFLECTYAIIKKRGKRRNLKYNEKK